MDEWINKQVNKWKNNQMWNEYISDKLANIWIVRRFTDWLNEQPMNLLMNEWVNQWIK